MCLADCLADIHAGRREVFRIPFPCHSGIRRLSIGAFLPPRGVRQGVELVKAVKEVRVGLGWWLLHRTYHRDLIRTTESDATESNFFTEPLVCIARTVASQKWLIGCTCTLLVSLVKVTRCVLFACVQVGSKVGQSDRKSAVPYNDIVIV